jgi:hypothetical protein
LNVLSFLVSGIQKYVRIPSCHKISRFTSTGEAGTFARVSNSVQVDAGARPSTLRYQSLSQRHQLYRASSNFSAAQIQEESVVPEFLLKNVTLEQANCHGV